MKVLFLAAGAVGLPVAARVSELAEVYAVCRRDHASGIREQGFRQITGEAFAVATAEGASFPWKTAENYLKFLRTVQVPSTSGHRSSMLQDLERGRKTEIDFLNGAVVTRGIDRRIPVPVNHCITELIRFREEMVSRKDGT